jgi:outer membrane protein assembly factor BamA
MKWRVLLIICLALYHTVTFAQGKLVKLADSLLQADLPFIIAPILYHTPETSWGYGGSLSYVFKTGSTDTRLSNINVQAVHTRFGQSLFRFSTDVFTPNEKWFIHYYAGYRYYVDRFYGLGPLSADTDREDFSFRGHTQRLSLLKKVYPGLFAGINLRYQHMFDLRTAPGKSLNSGLIQGGNGSETLGAGPEVSYDTRDNIMSATRGWYMHFTYRWHPQFNVANPAFQTLSSDFRHFHPIGKHVWANRIKTEHRSGNPPFRELALAGGGQFARGYFEGRYRDKHLAGIETEFRWHVWRMIGLTTYGTIFQVAPQIDQLFTNPWRASYGAGFRFFVNQKDRLVLRIDYARTTQGHSGFYLSVNEAF